MAPPSPPSFYKILLNPSQPHLSLPPAFVTRHLKNKIPTNPTLRSATGGYSWRLKIKRIGENYCFVDGWKNVVEDVHLGFGDFLLFSFVDQNTFQVRIYAPNACVKDLPEKVQVEDDGCSGGGGGAGDGDDGGVDDDGIGDDGDPFFITVIAKSHLNCLRLPNEFVELAGIHAEQTLLTLKNLAGKEWPMNLRWERLGKTIRYYVASGWRNFYRTNRLSQGDQCVFKFIPRESKLYLAKVTKNPKLVRSGRPPLKHRGRPPTALQNPSVVYF